MTGTVEVKLWVSSTAPDTDFTAKLIDEIPPNPDYPAGLRPEHRRLDPAGPLPRVARPAQARWSPARSSRSTITLYPTANVFKKGHRIRVDVSSSNYPRFDVNPNTGDPPGTYRRLVVADNTVVHDAEHPSHVLLPVIPKGP